MTRHLRRRRLTVQLARVRDRSVGSAKVAERVETVETVEKADRADLRIVPPAAS